MPGWNRVATVPMHRTLFDSIAVSQKRLAETQAQLASGKKAPDYASLGIETMRNLSARTLLARQEAHAAVGVRIGTTLALMDGQIGGIEEAGNKLRDALLAAVGTGRADGLQEVAEEAFQRFRTALNSDEAGVHLFGGSRSDSAPFLPPTLASTVSLTVSGAFANDEVAASARVSDGLDVTYGITARALGERMYEAFRTLAASGPLADAPSPAQMAAIQQAVGELNEGLATVRSLHAENGRRQAQVEGLTERAAERSLILQRLVAKNEDADMAEVASTLAQRQMTLEASYSVFGRLATLSLVNFLK